MTARDVKFSDAISSIPSFCRAVSAAMMRAISGSTWARDRFRSAAGRTAASGMDPPGSGSYRGGWYCASGAFGGVTRIGGHHRVVLGEGVAVGHPGEVVRDRAQEKRLFRVVRGDLRVEALERDVTQVQDAREVAVAQEHVVRQEARVLVPRRKQCRDDELRAPVVVRDAVAVDDVPVDEFLELLIDC